MSVLELICTDIGVMPPLNESLPTSSLVKVLKKALPFVAVFIATFLFVGMQWPASSPGVRATVAVDFCLPTHITALSELSLIHI